MAEVEVCVGGDRGMTSRGWGEVGLRGSCAGGRNTRRLAIIFRSECERPGMTVGSVVVVVVVVGTMAGSLTSSHTEHTEATC